MIQKLLILLYSFIKCCIFKSNMKINIFTINCHFKFKCFDCLIDLNTKFKLKAAIILTPNLVHELTGFKFIK